MDLRLQNRSVNLNVREKPSILLMIFIVYSNSWQWGWYFLLLVLQSQILLIDEFRCVACTLLRTEVLSMLLLFGWLLCGLLPWIACCFSVVNLSETPITPAWVLWSWWVLMNILPTLFSSGCCSSTCDWQTNLCPVSSNLVSGERVERL